jgi:ubiquinone/menaquinone biosynthesis C-methylase UbiE
VRDLYGRYGRLGIYGVLPVIGLVGESSPARRRMVAALELRGGERVLDVGCGTGLNFAALTERVGPRGSIVGIDLTPEMLDRARERGWGNVELIEGDATSLPFRDESFSAVCSALALSVIPDWSRALREAWRVLEPGGRLAVLDSAPLTGWRRVLAPTTNALNRLLAGARPLGSDLVSAIAELSPLSGMRRQPPLGVWMVAWAEKPR